MWTFLRRHPAATLAVGLSLLILVGAIVSNLHQKSSIGPDDSSQQPQPLGAEAVVEAAIILAALGPGPGSDDDYLDLLERHRLEARYEALVVLRRYTLDGEGPEGISAEEARLLLGLTGLKPGESVELTVTHVSLPSLLARLVDPEVRPVSRTAALAKVDETEVHTVLRSTGLDLEARTLNGHPFSRLPVKGLRSYASQKVVDPVTDPEVQLSLREARLLDPSLAVGARVDAPPAATGLQFVLGLIPEVGIQRKHSPRIGCPELRGSAQARPRGAHARVAPGPGAGTPACALPGGLRRFLRGRPRRGGGAVVAHAGCAGVAHRLPPRASRR